VVEREVIDWRRVAIRIFGIGVACVVGAPVAWLVGRALGGERSIVGWFGFGLLAFVFLSAVVVASSALRAMFRIGEAGERLARPDVGITPPQLRRRGRTC